MKIINCEQRSAEWFDCRRGVITASDFDKIITTEGKPSKQRTKYLYQLAGEFVAGVKGWSYTNQAIENGITLEGEARAYYELTTGADVEQVGFCLSDCGSFGASPDGLIGDDGLLEIKCPNISTHVGYLLEDKIPTEYFQQTQGQLFVTGRKWLDFMSYSPGIKSFVKRVYPDLDFHAELNRELLSAKTELQQIIERIS